MRATAPSNRYEMSEYAAMRLLPAGRFLPKSPSDLRQTVGAEEGLSVDLEPGRPAHARRDCFVDCLRKPGASGFAFEPGHYRLRRHSVMRRDFCQRRCLGDINVRGEIGREQVAPERAGALLILYGEHVVEPRGAMRGERKLGWRAIGNIVKRGGARHV